MSDEQTAKHLTNALSSGKRPRGRPRTRWRDYVEGLAWSRFGIPPVGSKDRDAWKSQLDLLPAQSQKDKHAKENTLN